MAISGDFYKNSNGEKKWKSVFFSVPAVALQG